MVSVREWRVKIKEVPSAWIGSWGNRLDAGPYLSGAVDARMLMESPRFRSTKLTTVTSAIYHAGREARRWVSEDSYGVPFLSSSDILKADLTNLPLLSKKQVEANPGFLIRKGWTLITRSGTIGRMAYVRPDMDGMACSEHAMRVVPNDETICSGYLFAFLRSRYGVPMVVGGTYGSIIQSIEPEHIAHMPVPRMGSEIEEKAHHLVEQAAADRSKAAEAKAAAIRRATHLPHWTGRNRKMNTSAALARDLVRRMDAFYHSDTITRARRALQNAPGAEFLGTVTESIFEPNRGARRKVDDPIFGVPFLSSSEVFALDPKGDYLISRKQTPNLASLLVMREDLLVPRSGQIGGIIGRAVLPVPTIYGDAASEHLVRIRCRTQEDACYLWALLASEPGYWALVGTAFGSSIPSLDCELISRLSVPWINGTERDEIVELTQSALRLQDAAIGAERAAIALVEKAIEEAA